MQSERKIQEALARWAIQKNHHGVIPNCGVFGWEADLISINQNNNANEYEIKISRSDFRMDTRKRKHYQLQNASKYLKYPPPMYFWYCCPKGLICKEDIPTHAGFLEVGKGGYVVVVKRAPRLHRLSMTTNQLQYISRGLMLRYWKQEDKTC